MAEVNSDLAQRWPALRPGLRAVHTAVRAMIVRDQEAEDEALAAVAASPAFAGFGPPASPRPAGPNRSDVERGRWLVDRVLIGVARARDSVPETVPGTTGAESQQALVFWSLYLELGIPLDLLGQEQRDLVEPPLAGRDLTQKIEGRMWLNARPSTKATEGMTTLYWEVLAALRAGTDGPGRGGPESLTAGSFGYEWRRLGVLHAQAERELLTLLSVLGPEPLLVRLLGEGWGPLPSGLRAAASSAAELGLLINRLVERGLLVVSSGSTSPSDRRMAGPEEHFAGSSAAVALPAALHPLPAGLLSERDGDDWLDVSLRFLRAALPPDTHHYESWPEWISAEPHVRRLVRRAEQRSVRLADAADLLDRMSVFHRERGREAARAVEDGQAAVRLAEAIGAPNQELYVTYLTNLAMAYRAAGDLQAALPVMRDALARCRDAFGEVHVEYAECVNIYANLLGAARRVREASTTHEEALSVIRQLLTDAGEEDADESTMERLHGALREILNDFAGHLMASGSRVRGQRALSLLDEAMTVGDPDGYGVEQIMLNRAAALRKLGDHAAARDTLTALVARLEPIGPSLIQLAAYADLADVLEDLDDPRHVEMLARAHEIDDALREPEPGDDDA